MRKGFSEIASTNSCTFHALLLSWKIDNDCYNSELMKSAGQKLVFSAARLTHCVYLLRSRFGKMLSSKKDADNPHHYMRIARIILFCS